MSASGFSHLGLHLIKLKLLMKSMPLLNENCGHNLNQTLNVDSVYLKSLFQFFFLILLTSFLALVIQIWKVILVSVCLDFAKTDVN